MITDPSPTAQAIRFTGYRLDERLQAMSGRSRPCCRRSRRVYQVIQGVLLQNEIVVVRVGRAGCSSTTGKRLWHAGFWRPTLVV